MRVECLYRVSTKGQVDKDDIPMQRLECRQFAQRQGWTIVKEYSEKGVSGFKVSASKRDAIQEIRADAEAGRFDILLVFMFDRLGRREDETPFLVEWFVKNGIQVWSAKEGQQKFENHVDKLLNYIRYWQASGESEKTSVRIKTKHRQMIEDGLWRGGKAPFGYRTVHKGRTGRKNRPLYDLEIDPAQAEIVRKIFDAACNQGLGIHRLANLLNSLYPDPDKTWVPQTIRTILKNPIYTGRMRFNDMLSPVQEELRIISDAQFEFAQHVLQDRIHKRYRLDEDGATKTSRCGAALLSGILYCGHCDHKLVGTYATKTRNGKEYTRPIYRCYNGAIHARHCDGQRTYSAMKIEEAVLTIVKEYFRHFNDAVDAVWQEQVRLQLRRNQNQRMTEAQHKLDNLQKQQKSIKQEILKSMAGESAFDQRVIQEMFEENAQAIAKVQKEMETIEQEKDEADRRLKQLMEQYQNISEWSEVFDDASVDEKKMILSRLIEKITVDRDYHITIYFYITLDQFKESLASLEKVTIEERQPIQNVG